MSVNGGLPVGYTYDTNSRLTQVAQGMEIVGLSYDLAGRRTDLNYSNGTSTTYTYDIASRLTNITHQSGATPFESITYAYDVAGNRISLDRTNGASILLPDGVQAAYDAANEQIQFNSTTPNLTYDANGNLVSQTDATGPITYTWDARNRLIGISGLSTTASFVYDALGRRTSKTINGVQTDYQYDGNDIVTEIGGGAVGASYLRSLNIDEPFVRQGTSTEYYHVDALGSTLDLTDSAGAVSTSYEYEVFGKTIINGISTNPFEYTGRENDGTGLYYYRARYYSPGLGRFVGEDPRLVPFTPLSIGLCRVNNLTLWYLPGRIRSVVTSMSQELNSYAYVRGNPTLLVDPTGLVGQCNYNGGAAVDGCLGSLGDAGSEPSGQGPNNVRACLGTELNSLRGCNERGGRVSKKCAKEQLENIFRKCTNDGRVDLRQKTKCVPGLSDCIDKDRNYKP